MNKEPVFWVLGGDLFVREIQEAQILQHCLYRILFSRIPAFLIRTNFVIETSLPLIKEVK